MRIANFIITLSIIFIISSCGENTQNNTSEFKADIDSVAILKQHVAELQKEIELLKYPANQRLASIKEDISNDNLDKALSSISNLENLFPDSPEAKLCPDLRSQISNKKEELRKEQERLEALGFKALSVKNTITIGYNTISLSNISVGNKFVFDAYEDRWFYRDADRGNRYVTMAMAVKSSSKNPELPQFAVYTIAGKTMSLESTFKTEYARWSDYGSYLGNYHDSKNDFAKVSTVYFKLGCEVSENVVKGPYAIVVKNENVLTENYDRFKNPPQYWTGSASYPQTLSIEDFTSRYTLVRLSNLK